MKKVFSLLPVFILVSVLAVSCNTVQDGSDVYELDNNTLELLLNSSNGLPEALSFKGGENILAGLNSFRISFSIVDENGKRLWADEDSRGEIKYGIISSGLKKSVPPVFETVLKSPYFKIKRSFFLQEDKPVLNAEYLIEPEKNVLVRGDQSVRFPYIKLASFFDEFLVPLPDGGIEKVPMHDIALGLSCPFSLPLAASSEAKDITILLEPGKYEGFGFMKDAAHSGGIVPVSKSDKMSFSFTLTILAGPDRYKRLKDLVAKHKGRISASEFAWTLAGVSLRVRKKEPRSALALSMKAIKIDPSCAMAYNSAAYAYQGMRDPVNKARCWLKAYELDPRNSAYAEWAANSIRQSVRLKLMPRSEMKKAMELYKKSMETGPRRPFAFYCAAQAYDSTGDYAEALKLYRKALELFRDPGHPRSKEFIPKTEKYIKHLEKKLGEEKNSR